VAVARARAAAVVVLMAVTLGSCRSASAPPPGSTAPRLTAADVGAESSLKYGMVAAAYYFTDSLTYIGFDAAHGEDIDPSVSWADGGGATVPLVVHVHVVSGTDLILDAMSASGVVLCVEWNGTAGTTRGTTDATTAAGCVGTSW
jgi:hypothetical protein